MFAWKEFTPTLGASPARLRFRDDWGSPTSFGLHENVAPMKSERTSHLWSVTVTVNILTLPALSSPAMGQLSHAAVLLGLGSGSIQRVGPQTSRPSYFLGTDIHLMTGWEPHHASGFCRQSSPRLHNRQDPVSGAWGPLPLSLAAPPPA